LRTQLPSGPADSLSGLIERVTFHNDENGFAVLQVKAKSHRDLADGRISTGNCQSDRNL